MLSIISSHLIKPFFAFSPKIAPNNGNRNIEIINGLPNNPNDTPRHNAENKMMKITTVVSEK